MLCGVRQPRVRPAGGGEGGKEEHSVLIGHICTCTVTYVLKKMTFTTTFPVFFWRAVPVLKNGTS